MLLRFTQDRDVPCPRCGYNLRALVRSVCPECGQPLALRIGAAVPNFGLLLLTIMPMIAYGALISAVGTLMLCVALVFGAPGKPPAIAIFVWLVGYLDVLGVFRLYLSRTRFFALSRGVQAVVAGGMWLLHGAIFAAVLASDI